MVFETASVLILSIISDIMKEHFDSRIIQDLIKYYNRSLSQMIDRIGIQSDCLFEVKQDILMGALDFCNKYKSKFDPTKGNALSYFATLFKSYVFNEVKRLKEDKKRLVPIQREKRINDLLGIPNPEPKHIIYNI